MALDLFSLYFTNEVWELLVRETNRYASTVVGTTPNSRPWNDTTVPEIKAFIGMLLLFGVLKLPRLELYWSKNYLELETPGISEIMPRIRFEQLFRCFHIANNEDHIPFGQPGHDKLFKVRPLLDTFLPKFMAHYNIHQECSIDEAMIPFKGRLGFKQYLKDKPIKWGIKVFVLADAHNGYIKNLQVYTGKGIESRRANDIGLCTKVVLDLMEEFDGSGLHLYTDNYYTSPTLYQHLYKHGINACGTCSSSRRGFPKDIVLKPTELNRGKFQFRSNGPLLATSWVDKRTINFFFNNTYGRTFLRMLYSH